MGKIAVLPDQVANQIAAGEVVERPASVIKELVENSIDAGATRLQIVVDQGGRELTVTDDGAGMTSDDALLAFTRFATSKLRAADDLWALQTLGFRGEALPSIAAIAEVECVTRQSSAAMASRLLWRGGELLDQGETGGPVGTTFRVRELFFNTPARLRFMRSPGAETAAITELVTALALAYPSVAFTLTSGGRELLRTPGGGDLAAAIKAAWGRDLAEHLFAVEGGDEAFGVHGFATRASYHRGDRSKQFIFVNGRWVKLPFLTKLIDEFYADLLPSKRYPAVVLHLHLDPASLDVNVHPTKREVRLREAGAVRELLVAALGGAVALQAVPAGFAHRAPERPTERPVQPMADAAPRLFDPPPHRPSSPAPVWPSQPAVDPDEIASAPRSQPPAARPVAVETQAAMALYRPLSAPEPETTICEQAHDEPAACGHVHDMAAIPAVSELGSRFVGLVALGQIHHTYIVAAGPEGLFLIDQHTAHERVLFEKLSREMTLQSQMLLVPLAVDAMPGQVTLVQEHAELLTGFGFSFEILGDGHLAITAVPQLLSLSHAELAWADLIEDLEEFGAVAERGARLAAIRKTIACKAAVKAGDTLTLPQMQELLGQLVAVDQPYTCPHGRPVVSVLPKDELDRRFNRTWEIKG